MATKHNYKPDGMHFDPFSGFKKWRLVRDDGKTVMVSVSRYRQLKREGRLTHPA